MALMKQASKTNRRLFDALTMLLVTGLSLMLVIYVGYGEAQRTYNQFQVEKLRAQAKILHTAMGTYLKTGLPLKQYVGFATRAEAILASDPSLSAMSVFDGEGNRIFISGDEAIPLLPESATPAGSAEEVVDLRETNEYIQLVLPLRNKFETVGSLAVTMPRATVTARLDQSFVSLLIVGAFLTLGFTWFASVAGPRLAGHRTPWMQIAYAVTFLAMSGVVVGTLISIYSDGAQAKTRALTDSLGQRVRDIVEFNLNINEFDGLDQIFEDYRRLNPDISAAGLTVNGKVVIHTDSSAIGQPWRTDRQAYEYVIDLTRHEKNANQIQVAVALPVKVVFRQVLRSVKNFAALFVASGFLAGLFLQLARSLQRVQSPDSEPGLTISTPALGESELSLVKPVFFIAVFVEHLTYSFLPQFMQELAAAAGLSASFASAPFMAFYLCFALTLVPAGIFAQQIGSRKLTFIGLVIASTSLLALALTRDFYVVMILRAAAGVGQGMLFIGVQCYILAKASPGKKTQGAAIIVYGFQGGMISGMAIGSLLVVYMGAQSVFTLAGAIAVGATLYTLFLVPPAPHDQSGEYAIRTAVHKLGGDLFQVLRSIEFMRVMFLIGIPAKAVMTGIVIFALPLILSQSDYAQEDIGQIIMLYAAGVLISSTYISRLVDRIGQTDVILFLGSTISGIGLLLIGTAGWSALEDWPNGDAIGTASTIIGVVIVGLAHGFVNAPVITRVAESKLADRIGAGSATASYRFLERLGHVAGPIMIGQMFVFAGQSTSVVGWVGAAILVFGIFFIAGCAPPHFPQPDRENSDVQSPGISAA